MLFLSWRQPNKYESVIKSPWCVRWLFARSEGTNRFPIYLSLGQLIEILMVISNHFPMYDWPAGNFIHYMIS